ncbi:MAG: DNA translocase FtsK [Dehalococcoidia bacterium]|nr:DNA translocase FtsK [Dehalococcoidia bacterium]
MPKADSAPLRVRRGNPKPKRKANSRRAERKGFFNLIVSPVVRRLILIIVIACVLFLWGPVIWKNMLTLFGLGLAIIAAALGVIIWIVWRGFPALKRRWNCFVGGAILALGLWGVLSFFSAGEGILSQATLGGEIGQRIAGSSNIIGGLRVAGLILLGIIFIAPRKIWHAVAKTARSGRRLPAGSFQTRPEAVSLPEAIPAGERSTVIETPTGPSIVTPPPVSYEPKMWQSHREPILTSSGWQLPPIDILDKPAEVKLDKEDIDQRARLIEEALASYGVEAKIVQINMGPTVTQFGVEPGWDRKYKEVREKGQSRMEEVSKTRIRVDRITSLANDLALALAAPSIRIEAPVPGKSLVGIEVPNTVFGSVSVRSAIETAAFQKVKVRSKLAIALGKGAGGEAVAADLTKMPHLLIAGATGSGKTVCLNSVICCLLVHNSPDDVQFIMVDPKRVELVTFNGMPHLLAPVVVDSDKAIKALRWLNQEMDNRYREFAQVGVRNIDGYNKDRSPGDGLPYLVLIIDELADLMMAACDEVEHTLCRLAQLARATGIHLIVATQRPSVDVVTGLIKANFPTRISFAVTSQVDSRTILDAVGAEKLLGRGDMLYMPTEAGKPKRLQGCFVSDAEIGRLVYFWGNQRQLTESINFDELAEPSPSSQRVVSPDSLLEEARRLAQEHKHISTSFLQRRLRIGYPRAARLMETLREEGLAGTTQPGEGS